MSEPICAVGMDDDEGAINLPAACCHTEGDFNVFLEPLIRNSLEQTVKTANKV